MIKLRLFRFLNNPNTVKMRQDHPFIMNFDVAFLKMLTILFHFTLHFNFYSYYVESYLTGQARQVISFLAGQSHQIIPYLAGHIPPNNSLFGGTLQSFYKSYLEIYNITI